MAATNGCMLDWHTTPPGSIEAVAATSLAGGTGSCSACKRYDQVLYITARRGGWNGSDGNAYQIGTTLASLCQGCAHKLLMDLWEIVFK